VSTLTAEPNAPGTAEGKLKLNKRRIFELLGYKVFEKEVARFHNSEARVKIVTAPRRTSKSYSSSHDVLPDCLLPGARVWIVGPSYGLAEKEFRCIHEALVLKRNKLGLPKPKVCMTNPRSGQLFIQWPWGAVVEGKSADRPESLLGEAVDKVIYSEGAQLPRAIRERYVHPTVVTKKGTEIIPTTPEQGAEWVHELIEKAETGEFPDIESFRYTINANPKYDRSEFERAKKFYGEDSPVFREQYLGEWVFYGGVVYNTFNPNLHVIEPFDIPSGWPRYRCIDFGHRDPFVCLWFAVGPHQELYFYREYYTREGRSMREHADYIKKYSMQENIKLTVGDPQAKQSIDDLCYEGIPVAPANNDRAAGRMRVLEYLQPTEDGPPPWPIRELPARYSKSKWPRVYFFNTMKETLREFKYYRWKEVEKIREGEKEKTEGEDHSMDAKRYGIMERPSPSKSEKRIPMNSFKGILSRMRSNKLKGSYLGVG
jgi:phage terminase large subunit